MKRLQIEQILSGFIFPIFADLEGTAQPGPTTNADEIAAMSADNEIEKSVPKAANAIVTNVTRQGNQTTSSTSVTTIQAPLTRASNILSSVTAR